MPTTRDTGYISAYPVVVAYSPNQEITVDYLVVAGGGAGGSAGHGGGGGGGMRSTVTATGGTRGLETALQLFANQEYLVTVGAGGAVGSVGSDSQFHYITSFGGGYISTNGGSGGGTHAFFAGSGTIGQGFKGGQSRDVSPYAAGGGGGAGQEGVSNTGGSIAGNGGNGVACEITGSSVTYAGGGGGGVYLSGTAGSGGLGGGGAGGSSPVAGTANLGGGGGGKSGTSGGGGTGGSGVVVLRYPDTLTITIGAGLTGTESGASGGYKRATFTAGTGNVSWA